MIFALLIFLTSAWAKLPPSYFVYEQISELAPRPNGTSLIISISRPLGSGNEELLGTLNLPSWENKEGAWPALSLLFPANKEQLKGSIKNFGLKISEETELVRLPKDKILSSKDPVKPFYKPDPRMHLRQVRGTYAWVHEEADRSVWIEKDTFLPLKVSGPCPPGVSDLGWSKGGSSICEIEFRNILSARRGAPSNSRLTLWQNGAPILFLSLDRVGSLRAFDRMPPSAEISDAVKSILDTILH